MSLKKARHVRPGEFVSIDDTEYTVRYIYYLSDGSIRLDLERGKHVPSYFSDKTEKSPVMSGDSNVIIID